MKMLRPALALILTLTGCMQSLHPVYRPADVVFEPALIGQWISESDTWTVSRAGDGNAYRVVHADKTGRAGLFLGHVFRVGEHLFVDLVPVQTDYHTSDFHRDHSLPMHSFYLITRIEPAPRFAYMNQDWLKQHLKENPSALRHETFGKNMIITAPTAEVQAFLLRHVNTKGAFEPTGGEWRRAVRS